MIGDIPAILWGSNSDRIFLAIHGAKSHKADAVIELFASIAVKAGYQVLSFDLPKHGDRKDEAKLFKARESVQDLGAVMSYAKARARQVSVFACSISAYFCLLAYKEENLQRCLFLTPVIDMESVIQKFMTWFDVTKDRLRSEQEITTPIGEVLYWDYYCYVRDNPITSWPTHTSILCGGQDDLCDLDITSAFSKHYNCELTVLKGAGHYLQTEEHYSRIRQWIGDYLTR